jgi:hypothetical protein
MSERGEHFLKSLAGSRASVVGHPVPIADMGRVMFLEDVFLGSETDIAFLNSFGMRAAFDGVDLFPPREAAFIRAMAPSRIRVLGTVDPPDGASAIESLIYQCETIKIDGLKLYPPGPDARGWILDDGLRLHRSATARRTNFAGMARSRRCLRQHAAGKVAEIEVAAGKGEVASRAEAMCRTPCRRRRHPHSPDGHRLRKFAPDSMLEGDGFELVLGDGAGDRAGNGELIEDHHVKAAALR